MLAILTKIPLVAAEEGYDADEAARFLREVSAYKDLNKIDAVEILRGVGGP